MKNLTLINYMELSRVELYQYQKEIVDFMEGMIKSKKLVKCSFLSAPSLRPNIFSQLMKKNDPEEIKPPEEGTEGWADTEIG